MGIILTCGSLIVIGIVFFILSLIDEKRLKEKRSQ